MASHHHCHPSTTATTTCFYCHSSATSHHPPPPPEPPLIIHSHSHLPYPTLQQPHQHFYNPLPLQPQNSNHHLQEPQPRRRRQEDDEMNQTLISSLLRRISALESSVRRQSNVSFSLRDAAARVIQIHFRAFLVRRSRTLRQLKELACIKSALNTLKLNHSNNTRSDSRALSHKALNLLNKLEHIQGSDPMIRDGKRSINKELIRFMDYLDELSVKRYQLSGRVVKNLRIGGSGTKSRVFNSDQRMSGSDSRGRKEEGERDLLEKLRKRVEKMEGYSRVSEEDEEDNVDLDNCRIYENEESCGSRNRSGVLVKRQAGAQAKAKKSVRFAENGKVYMVYKGSNGPVSFVECHSNDGSDLVDAEEMGRESEEIGTGDDEEEDEESPQVSDDDRSPRRNTVGESDNESSGHEPIENEDGSFVFSAPLPVKMEPRADLLNKKTLKIG